jgi:hypothetical protein
VVAVLVVSSASASAAEPPWEPARRACVANLELQCEAIHGANCNGWWPSVARCAIHATWGDNPALIRHVNDCIAWQEDKQYMQKVSNKFGDPIREIIWCSTGQ